MTKSFTFTSSLEELDKLSGIGPVKAQAIIDTRPFDSVDDLISVSGIGEVTLNNIKSQGLACVDSETEDDEEFVEDNKNNKDINETQQDLDNTYALEIKDEIQKNSPKEIELITIGLNPKDIKSENNSENLKGNYAIYGFIAFSILIIVLLIFRKNKYKNEFR